MSDLVESLVALEKCLESNKNSLIQGLAINVTEESETANKYLSSKAQAVLQNKSKTLSHKDVTGSYVCIYLGLRVDSTRLQEGIKVICERLNALVDKDLVHSCLTPVSTLPLAHLPLEVPTCCVLAYVLVPEDKRKEAEELAEYVIDDYAMPMTLGSVEAKTSEDEFFSVIKISNFPLLSEDETTKKTLDDQIQQIINILPKGTQVVDITQCSVVDLSFTYQVRFRNPLMANYKEVRLKHIREFARVGYKIEQFQLLTEVEYVRKDSK